MLKKMILLAMAVGALAAPTAAQAARLQYLSGETVLKGTQVKATSTNMLSNGPTGYTTCSEWTIQGEVTKNSGTETKITPYASPNGMVMSTCYRRDAETGVKHSLVFEEGTGGPLTLANGSGSFEASNLEKEPGIYELAFSGTFNITYGSGSSEFGLSGVLYSMYWSQEWAGGSFNLTTSTGTPIKIVN